MESAMQIGQPVGGENIVEIQHGSAAAATATAAQPPIGAGVTTAIGSETKHPESFEIHIPVIATGSNNTARRDTMADAAQGAGGALRASRGTASMDDAQGGAQPRIEMPLRDKPLRSMSRPLSNRRSATPSQKRDASHMVVGTPSPLGPP